MPSYTDQLNNTIHLTATPQRIVSLVPSLTELVVDLGAGEQLVGRTKFCIHPKHINKMCVSIGGTKNININKLHNLTPDLIIANKEENTLVQIQQLQQQYPVWISDVNTYDDALHMITGISQALNKVPQGITLINAIEHAKHQLQYSQTPQVAYLMWHKPYMAAANNTFINSMLQQAGFTNVFANLVRYPIVTINDLQHAAPEFIFLSSEPFPFAQQHIAQLQQHVPHSKLILVDGELFSWYGSRLVQAFHYFKTLRNALHLN